MTQQVNVNWGEVEYERNMVFSIGHITKEDGEMIEDAASPDSMQNVLVVHTNEYFHLVHVPSVNLNTVRAAGYSEQFARILGLAKLKGVDFVKLDRDGPVYEWLEEYDW
jgi:hypothetical protein